MSNNHITNHNDETANTGSSLTSRREIRANNMTGALPSLNTSGIERGYVGAFDFEEMLLSLHDLFEQDRQTASQPDATRCGICYLHFSVSELHYHDEGLYLCETCERALGKQTIHIVRKQQKL